MKRFVFFTKTDWSEPPRLRHQLARLLTLHGNEVVFFEKPNSCFSKNKPLSPPCDKKIQFYRTGELIHHKLRLNSFLRTINSTFEHYQIRKTFKFIEINNSDVIINFNYEYYFLRGLFPDNKIITIINDDFWCRALWGYEKPLRDALILTCQNSDVVLAVSYPLIDQLSAFCQPHLFLPWAGDVYRTIGKNSAKTRLLFWGYINNRLNFDYVLRLANGINELGMGVTIDFVGPVQKNIDPRFSQLKAYPNVNTQGPTEIDKLDMDSVLAAFIPYVEGNKADDVTTLPNKAFPMLMHGLPLLITGMPNFIEEPFVLRLGKSIRKDLKQIASLNDRLSELQTHISAFVNNNTGQRRYEQFVTYL